MDILSLPSHKVFLNKPNILLVKSCIFNLFLLTITHIALVAKSYINRDEMYFQNDM